MKIALDTLGCKLNQAETDSLARQFVKAGHTLVSSVDEADIYVLNTCTVTNSADAKSRHLLRQAHRQNARTLLVATGCYAQRAPQDLTRIEGVCFITDNAEKSHLLRLLEESGCLDSLTSLPESCATKDKPAFRTRAFVKIQDGCTKFCSYCIVPLVRKRETSLPPDQVIAEVRQRVAEGVREVVLTGTEIGSYDHEGVFLESLLEGILAGSGVTRLRLSSLQPQEISPGLIRLWSDGRLCPHFHLSLQSGNDSVLRRMKRGYSVKEYQAAVSLIRDRVPDVAITTDIISGFPGETAAEFEASYEACRQMGFARIHVFPYSTRQGTAAADLPDQVEPGTRKRRSLNLLALAKECAVDFNRQFLERIVPVLWEQQSGGIWSGHTANYIKVYHRSDEKLTNQLLPVKLFKIRGDGVWGER